MGLTKSGDERSLPTARMTGTSSPAGAAPAGIGEQLAHWSRVNIRLVAPIITMLVMATFFALTTESFIRPRNIVNILEQASLLSILAGGVTLVVLVAEMDLSFANLATLVAVVLAYNFGNGVAWWLSILVAIGVAALVGVVNGGVSSFIGVPSFIATLAMMQITHGYAIYMTGGRPLFDVPAVLHTLGNGWVGPVPVILLVAAVVMAALYFVLNHTVYGRTIYMVGGNREASRLAGVNVRLVVGSVFLIASLLAGLYGLLGAGRLGTAQPGTFSSLLIDSLGAVVLGGTSLFGGEGGVQYTVIGVLIYTVLANGLDMMDINIYLKTFITGAVLLLAVVFNVYLQHYGKVERQ